MVSDGGSLGGEGRPPVALNSVPAQGSVTAVTLNNLVLQEAEDVHTGKAQDFGKGLPGLLYAWN